MSQDNDAQENVSNAIAQGIVVSVVSYPKYVAQLEQALATQASLTQMLSISMAKSFTMADQIANLSQAHNTLVRINENQAQDLETLALRTQQAARPETGA